MLFTQIDWNEVSLIDSTFYASQHIRPDFPIARVSEQLDRMTEDARHYLCELGECTHQQKLEVLLHLFYNHWGFTCSDGIYTLSDALWIDQTLDEYRGSPVSLGVILCTLAERLDIPVVPVVFPHQLLLKTRDFHECWGVNPADGHLITSEQLKLWVQGYYGLTSPVTVESLEKCETKEALFSILNILKSAFLQEGKFEHALLTCELMLSLQPGDPYLLRDRGLLYAQLDCAHLARIDLNAFILKCPDDPAADILKVQVQSLNYNHVILH